MADVKEAVFRIRPGTYRSLEQLHHRPNHMEDKNDLRLANSFHPQHQHQNLDGQRRKEEKIVARKPEVSRPHGFGEQQQRQHRSAEEACPPLFENKQENLPQQSTDRRTGNVILKPDANGMKSCSGVSEHRVTPRRWRRASGTCAA